MGKSSPKNVAQSRQSLRRRKFAQSGHPGLDSGLKLMAEQNCSNFSTFSSPSSRCPGVIASMYQPLIKRTLPQNHWQQKSHLLTSHSKYYQPADEHMRWEHQFYAHLFTHINSMLIFSHMCTCDLFLPFSFLSLCVITGSPLSIKPDHASMEKFF
jgi:hypothetical protein